MAIDAVRRRPTPLANLVTYSSPAPVPVSATRPSFTKAQFLSRHNAPSPLRGQSPLANGFEFEAHTPTLLSAGFLTPPASPFSPSWAAHSPERAGGDADYLPSPSSILTIDAICQLEGLAKVLDEKYHEQGEECTADLSTAAGQILRLGDHDVMSVHQQIPQIVVGESSWGTYDGLEEAVEVDNGVLSIPTQPRASRAASLTAGTDLESIHTEDIQWVEEYGSWGTSNKGKWRAPCDMSVQVTDDNITEPESLEEEPCYSYCSGAPPFLAGSSTSWVLRTAQGFYSTRSTRRRNKSRKGPRPPPLFLRNCPLPLYAVTQSTPMSALRTPDSAHVYTLSLDTAIASAGNVSTQSHRRHTSTPAQPQSQNSPSSNSREGGLKVDTSSPSSLNSVSPHGSPSSAASTSASSHTDWASETLAALSSPWSSETLFTARKRKLANGTLSPRAKSTVTLAHAPPPSSWTFARAQPASAPPARRAQSMATLPRTDSPRPTHTMPMPAGARMRTRKNGTSWASDLSTLVGPVSAHEHGRPKDALLSVPNTGVAAAAKTGERETERWAMWALTDSEGSRRDAGGPARRSPLLAVREWFRRQTR